MIMNLWATICEHGWNYRSQLGDKSYHNAVVEALDPPGMVHTSMITYARCLITFICCGWADESIIMPLPPYLWTQIWEYNSNPGSQLVDKSYHNALTEALNPPGMVPTSMINICKVCDNFHMLWMGRVIYHHAIITTLVGPDLGILGHSWTTIHTTMQWLTL
jgi:hypothetical protein